MPEATGPSPDSGASPRTGSAIRLMCVDDSPDVLRMLRIAASGESGIVCVALLESADRMIEEATAHRPDVVLLDLSMPGRNPLEALAELSKMLPSVRVLGFSGFDSPDHWNAVIEAGGWGLVSKHEGWPVIYGAIRSVADGAVVRPGR